MWRATACTITSSIYIYCNMLLDHCDIVGKNLSTSISLLVLNSHLLSLIGLLDLPVGIHAVACDQLYSKHKPSCPCQATSKARSSAQAPGAVLIGSALFSINSEGLPCCSKVFPCSNQTSRSYVGCPDIPIGFSPNSHCCTTDLFADAMMSTDRACTSHRKCLWVG
jgi:hypothetical protein